MHYDDVTVTCDGEPVTIDPYKLLRTTLGEHFRHQTLRFKTLTGQTIVMKTKTTWNIGQVKTEYILSQGLARDSDLKLIYTGLILRDEQLVQDLKYWTEESFMVVMIKKARFYYSGIIRNRNSIPKTTQR